MRILDLDLDLFLNRVFRGRRDNERLPADQYAPWSEFDVRCFLERQCGLSAEVPTPGKYFIEHDALYWHLQSEIGAGRITSGFELVHADAHSDLGMGLPSGFVKAQWLAKPVHQRLDPPASKDRLCDGSWLLFVAAARWPSRIIYVRHDTADGFQVDVPVRVLRHDDGRSEDFLELPRCEPNSIGYPIDDGSPIALEPAIPFQIVASKNYRGSGTFDFVFLTQSPRYTPATADHLIPVILSYIQL